MAATNGEDERRPEDERKAEPDPIEEAKRMAKSMGSSLLSGIKEQARKTSERNREWNSRRKLSGAEWALCFLLPPLGIWRVWKDRQNIQPHHAVYAPLGGCLTMLLAGFMGFVILMVVANWVGDVRSDMRRARAERAADAAHERVLPEYEDLMAEAVALYEQRSFGEAEQAFFRVTRYVEDVKSDDETGIYYSRNWDNRHASALLGRAASALEQGLTQEGYALVREALDVSSSSSDMIVPVSSLRIESYLRQQVEQRREESSRLLEQREAQRRQEEAARDRQRIVDEIREDGARRSPNRSRSSGETKDGYEAGYRHGYSYGTGIVNKRSGDHVLPAILDQEWTLAEIGLNNWANQNGYDVTRTYRNGFEQGFKAAQAGRGPQY